MDGVLYLNKEGKKWTDEGFYRSLLVTKHRLSVLRSRKTGSQKDCKSICGRWILRDCTNKGVVSREGKIRNSGEPCVGRKLQERIE